MAQTFYPIAPVEVTPDDANQWDDVDVSAHIPAGATGVILHCASTHFQGEELGLRKNGSSDDRKPSLANDKHCWAMIGVDGSRIFECYLGTITGIDIWLVGYTTAGVTFSTNADDKSLGAGDTGAWTDIDCSVEAPSAAGLIFERAGTFSALEDGLKKNGSADDRHYDVMYHSNFGAIIGCDGSQICEGYIEGADVDFWLLGYVTDGATFITNATDLSIASGAWINLTALPVGGVMGFIEVCCGSISMAVGLREEGSAEDIYLDSYDHIWGIVDSDASRVIEGKVEHTDDDFFLVGYSTLPAVAGLENKSANMAAKMVGAGII